DLETAAEVDERVAGEDRPALLDPEHEVVVLPSGKRLDPDRKPVTRRVQVPVAAISGQEPGDVGAAAGSLLWSDAVVLHEVVLGVRWWHEHRRSESLYEAPRLALVPRGGEHDHRLAVSRELED